MGEGASLPDMSPSADAGAATYTRAESIYAEQVRYLYHFSKVSYGGSLLCALVIVGGLWGIVAPAPLLAWAAAIVAVTASRYLVYRNFVKRSPPPAEARRWCTYFVLGSAVTGVVWGVLGSALYPSGSMP